jgi:hypothetical protein
LRRRGCAIGLCARCVQEKKRFVAPRKKEPPGIPIGRNVVFALLILGVDAESLAQTGSEGPAPESAVEAISADEPRGGLVTDIKLYFAAPVRWAAANFCGDQPSRPGSTFDHASLGTDSATHRPTPWLPLAGATPRASTLVVRVVSGANRFA